MRLRKKETVLPFGGQLPLSPKRRKKAARRAKKKEGREEALPLLRARLRIEVTGFHQARLLSELSKAGVAVRRVRRLSGQCLRFEVAKKDDKKTFAILERLCYTYSIVAASGARMTLKKCLPRLGLVAGLLAFSVLLAVSRGYIWRVEIAGNDKVSDAVLQKVLQSSAVSVGKPLKNVQRDAVRNAVNAVDGILESTVQIIGTTVTVTVIENTDYLPPDEGSTGDLVSAYDAEITRVVTKSGTGLVRPGQRVLRGTSLIGAYRLDEEGNLAERVPAKGTVYGKVALSRTLTFAPRTYISRPTGKTYRCTQLSLFGLKIGKRKNPYTNFLRKTTVTDLCRGNFFPIKVVRDELIETEYVEVTYDPQTRADELADQAVLDLVIACGGSEIERTVTLKQITETLYEVHVFVSAELPLCEA